MSGALLSKNHVPVKRSDTHSPPAPNRAVPPGPSRIIMHQYSGDIAAQQSNFHRATALEQNEHPGCSISLILLFWGRWALRAEALLAEPASKREAKLCTWVQNSRTISNLAVPRNLRINLQARPPAETEPSTAFPHRIPQYRSCPWFNNGSAQLHQISSLPRRGTILTVTAANAINHSAGLSIHPGSFRK